ncbi:scyllo-inositol 2-dehydrogenase (NADP+) [Pedobacter sp. CG_S7]|uniref:Gfo/Idh/MocA family oxidoreductase n=1 Tax=Pedobacter sp. CG_S7 TaxID=3143930 RepID=UPI003396E29C
MEKVIKTGLLAYGMSGKVFHAPFLDAHPGFKLDAILERNQKKAAIDYPNLKSFDTIDDLLNDESLELIVINTPNFTHYDYAKSALQKGKHILVEKPFTATAAQAKELFELAKQLDKKIFVYHNRRWDSDFNAVIDIIESGVLGKLNEVHIRYDRYRPAIGPKRFKEEPMPASGLMYDLGSHLIDQAISLFGKPLSHYKVLGKNRKETQVDDYFCIHLNYADSVNVFLHANMLVAAMEPGFVLHGEKGSFIKARADTQEGQLLKNMKPTDSQYGIEEIGSEGVLTLIDEEGNKNTTLITSGKGRYMELFESIYQSLTHGEDFPVKEEQVLWQLEILEA